MGSYWVQLAPIDGVAQHEIARIAEDLGITVVSEVQQDADWQTAIGESLGRFAAALAGVDRLCEGPEFLSHFGVGLDAAQRLARARSYAESGLPFYLQLEPMQSLIAGARDEAERCSLAHQCNTWLANAPRDECWVHDGAIRAAMRTGRLGTASFGATLSLSTSAPDALALARWLGADPARLPNVRAIWLTGTDLPGALAILDALGSREVEMINVPNFKPADRSTFLSRLRATVRGVNAHYSKFGAPFTAALTQSPAWPSLRSLDLHRNELKSAGLASLLAAERTAPIERLDLGYNGLKSVDFAALAAAPWMRDVRALRVKYNGAKAKGAQAFFARAELSSLRALDFGANEIGDAGVAALVANPTLTELESLSLEGNHSKPLITVKGAMLLARWEGAARVRSLNLAQNPLSAEGVCALLQSARWAALEEIDLQYCDLDGAFVRAMAAVETPARPRSVTLTGNALGATYAGPQDAQESPWERARWLSECRSLNLYNTRMTLDVLLQIARSTALANVRSLNVSSNEGLSNEALERLLASPMGQRIEHLEALYWRWQPGAAKLLAQRHAERPWMHLAISAEGLGEDEALALRGALGSRLSLS